MKKLATLLFALLLPILLVNAQFTIDQITQFGNSADQVPAGMSISNGAIYIAGNDAGQSMVLKYGDDNINTLLWSIQWPNTPSPVLEWFSGVAADANGVYVSGCSYSQTSDGSGDKEQKAIMCKFPLSGATGTGLGGADWIAKPTFFPYNGGELFYGNMLHSENDTNYIYSFGAAQENWSNSTAILAKHTTQGNLIWKETIGSTAAVQDVTDAICVLNNHIYVGGVENHFTLWKSDLAGNKIWSKSTEIEVVSWMKGLCASNQNLFATGYEEIAGRGKEALIIKYDEDGTVIWKKVWGGALEDIANGIEIIDNTLWVIGETSSYGSGGKDAFALKLNAADGSVIDSVFGGGPLDDAALKIVKKDQTVYISGTFQGTATFGPMTITSKGGKDVFLMKMNNGIPSTPDIVGIPVTPDANTVILDHFDGTNVGETVGSPQYVQGTNGLSQAIELSKPGNYIIYSKSVNMEAAGTVEMWVYPKKFAKGLLNINWNYTKSYPPAGHVFHLSLDSLGKVSLGTWGYSVSNSFKGNTKLPLNTWTHVTVTWGDSTRIYINGKLDMTSALLCRPAIRTQAYFYLPYWGDSTGYFDEFHVSKIKRTGAEIEARIFAFNPNKIYSVTPGGLSSLLSSYEKSNVTTLKLSGNIDARDFKTMRDSMPLLENLDMSQVNIVEYFGTDGPRYGVIEHYPANTIPRNAFVLQNGKTSLLSVVQPENLIGIGRSAYNRCYNLTNINWPSGIRNMGYAAFNDCQKLKEAVIYNGIAVIDTFVFRNCIQLTSIIIPSSVKEIRYGAFLQCTELSTPIFEPNSQLTHIGYFAFGFCPKITAFLLPPKVNHIGNVAFLGTSTEVTVPAGHSYFTNINGVLYDKALTRLLYCPAMKTGQIDIPPTVTNIVGDAFYNCRSLDSITIPASLKIIEDWAFENCTGLRTLTIPASVTEIWAYAFYNCSGLKALYVNTAAPVNLSSSDSVFNYIDKNACTLYVLSGLKAQYQAADKWKEFTNIVELSDAQDVTPGNLHTLWSKTTREGMKRLNLKGSIDARDFKTMRDSMPQLEYIDLSAVTIAPYTGTGGTWNTTEYVYFADKIPEAAFNNPNGTIQLNTILLPKNLKIIGRSAFNRCYNLKSVLIGPSVTSIDRLAFTSCGSLKSITLPGSVTTIQYGAFLRSGLTSITLPEGVKIMGEYALQNCNELVTITLPATLEYIGYCAITFNNSLKSIEVNASNTFFSSLEGVLFDKTRKTLVSYPNMNGINYKVPVGVEAIDTAAFEGCWALRTLELPTTLKTLSLEAFYGCNNLSSIEIPASVNSIEAMAFSNCYNLKIINARMVAPVDITASTDVFNGVGRNACILRVPTGSKYAYQAANKWNSFPNLAEDITKVVTITAGGLFNALTSIERNEVTHLKVNGTVDARDFKTMREYLPMLAEVDLRGASISAYTGTEGTAFYTNDYQSNAIPPEAFNFTDGVRNKNWLTSFLLPTTVTKIGGASFTNTGLRNITIHEGITNIEPWAFCGTQLNTVTLPATLATIGDWAFSSISPLASYTVASGNSNFSTINGCLYNKTAETLLYWPNAKSDQAIIPEGTVTIHTGAFEGCNFIRFINIPNTIKNIVTPAFLWTGNLWGFDVAETNPWFSTKDGVLYDRDQKKIVAYPNQKGNYYDIPYGVNEIGPSAFGGCWNLTALNIPMSVTKISNMAFYCTNLTRVVLPSSINTIDAEAFDGCEKLESITVNWYYPVNLSNSPNVFNGVDKATCVLKVPQGAAWNYKTANQWNEFSNIDEIQNVTYRVLVPYGTKACYIAGEMNGWMQQPMTKENSNIYSITLNAHRSDKYKYCSGPEWSFEELDTARNVINDRNYSPMDTVRTWRNVYQPWMPISPWKIQSNSSYSVGKIQFVSETEGWIASANSNGLLHSTDAGVTWNKVTPFPSDFTRSLSDPATNMDWVNASKGWILKTMATDSSTIFNKPNGAVMYSTTDGGLSWNSKVLPKSRNTITYSDADLLGTWQLHEIMEGDNQDGESVFSAWARSKMTIGTDGIITFSENVMSLGNWTPESDLKMSISPYGILSMNNSGLNGFMSADKNTAFFNASEKEGIHLFGVMQRQKPGTVYSLSDLQGTWQLHSLYLDNNNTQMGEPSFWVNGTATIDNAGNGVLNVKNNLGITKTINQTFTMSTDGIVNVVGNTWHGFMNVDKTAIYSTVTTNDEENNFSMFVMQKQAVGNTYQTKDLQGSWTLHDITAPNSMFDRKQATTTTIKAEIRADGTATIRPIYYNGEEASDDQMEAKLSVSTSGVVTLESDNLHGYMSVDKNTIIYNRSEDSGNAIGVFQRDSSYSGDLGLQVQFADENNGWASIYNTNTSQMKLYRTANGGTDWSPIPGNGPVGFFDFVDSNNGWAINMPMDTATNPKWSIVHTTDGGLNWSEQYLEGSIANNAFIAIQFTDLNHGWVTCDKGKLLKTVDGGLHWTEQTNFGFLGSTGRTLFFLDANTGWIAMERDSNGDLVIQHTTDGGNSWTEQNTNVTNGSIFSMFFWDQNHGWFTGESKEEFDGFYDYEGIIGRLIGNDVQIGRLSSNNEVMLYPNPVKDGFHIRSLEPGSMVNIYNLNGASVLKLRADGDCYVDVKDLKKGMYVVRITTSKGVINKKMIKM